MKEEHTIKRKDSASHSAKKRMSKLTKQVGKRSGSSLHSLRKITPCITTSKSILHQMARENDVEELTRLLSK